MMRTTIRLVFVILLALTADCLSGGSDVVVASGSPATVADAALASTGYEYVGRANRTLNTTLHASISGDVKLRAEQKVRLTTPIVRYHRKMAEGIAVFAVVAFPAVHPIKEQPLTLNPTTDLTTATLVEYAQNTYTDVRKIDQTGTRPVTLLGNKTTFVTYTGMATHEEKSVAVTIHIASVNPTSAV